MRGALGQGGPAAARRAAAGATAVLCVWEWECGSCAKGGRTLKVTVIDTETVGPLDLPTVPLVHPTKHTLNTTQYTAHKAMSWIRDRQEEEDEAAEEWRLEARAELVQLAKEGSRIKELRAARDACRTGGKV